MKIVVVSDSFKGALSSQGANAAVAAGVYRADPAADVIQIPVADGGEGTVAALVAAARGEIKEATVCGVFLGEPVTAAYGVLDDTTSVIEMAACAGLPLAAGRLDTGRATTFGVGELISHALNNGARHIIVGAGGSATTDMGCGAAAALGVRFYDAHEREFVPTGSTLSQVARIDTSASTLRGARVTVMCDIDNPLTGPTGSAAVFGPQKGADREQVTLLDAGLAHIANLIERDHGLSVSEIPGAGAAGGLAAGLVAFADATLQPGIDAVLDAVSFGDIVVDADLVITGEGRIDGQSLSGKVPVGVARRAAAATGAAPPPVVVLAGSVDGDIDAVYSEGITAVFPIGAGPATLAEAMDNTEANLSNAARNVVALCARYRA
ncbi:glycerate kinase [Corynebacterium sp.]|uniref:glycerate kinase n=1 Tax=Corynebacterium sp. TaxID=1720 RepID=UPI002A915C54|nr:glycerate kinase [Corynebacterium sp.]MDY5784527.1 glycerate kinase [Corynebacterium sp.]